jgi:hypothetical protein
VTDRLAIYLESCTICDHRDAAGRRIAEIDAAAAAREAEAAAYAAPRPQTAIPAALRDYLAGCIACDHKAAAEKTLAMIEADAAYQAEIAARDLALAARDRIALAAWAESCTTCEGKAEVETEIERLRQAEVLIGPCLAAAGLPQQGGPRQLEEIDIATARTACAAALAELPQNMQAEGRRRAHRPGRGPGRSGRRRL